MKLFQLIEEWYCYEKMNMDLSRRHQKEWMNFDSEEYQCYKVYRIFYQINELTAFTVLEKQAKLHFLKSMEKLLIAEEEVFLNRLAEERRDTFRKYFKRKRQEMFLNI